MITFGIPDRKDVTYPVGYRNVVLDIRLVELDIRMINVGIPDITKPHIRSISSEKYVE